MNGLGLKNSAFHALPGSWGTLRVKPLISNVVVWIRISADMANKNQSWVVYSGYVVLVAIVLMLVSMAFLRGGHPPGYGIVNLLILAFAYPVSLYASISGLRTSVNSLSVPVKTYFIMVGVCSTFALFATILLVLKFIFGKAI